jgi:hypothetical protein
VIIRSTLKHHVLQPYQTDKLQSACVSVSFSNRTITIAALYSPPKHMLTTEEYIEFLTQLGPYFLVAGDWNAKNNRWGSRITTRKGRNLLQATLQLHINHLSTGEPTYWPSDPDKTPDVLDFALTKGIPNSKLQITSSIDLASDHTAILITMSDYPLMKETPPYLATKLTNWQIFQEIVTNNIKPALRLKTSNDVDDAVHHWVSTIQAAAWQATPLTPPPPPIYTHKHPVANSPPTH